MKFKDLLINYKKSSVIVLSIFLFIISYFGLSVFSHTIDKDLYYIFKEFISNDNVSKDIVVIKIDDNTLNKTGFPMDRKFFLDTLKNIDEGKPASVGIDVFFADKGSNALTDKLLAERFKKSGNIVLGSAIIDDGKIEKPYNLFSSSIKSLSFFPPIIDPNNQKVYSVKPYINFSNGETIENFSFAILRNYYSYIYETNYAYSKSLGKENYSFPNNKVYLGDFDDKPELYINYSEPTKFSTLNFYDVYSGNFDRNQLKDKIVLIGYTAEGVKDDFMVPEYGIVKGIYVHANAINTVLQKDYIKYFDEKIEYIIGFLLILIIVYLNIFYISRESIMLTLFETFSIFIIIFLSYLISFIYFGIIFNFPFEFILSLIMAFILTSSIKSYFEEGNKIRLNKALSEYVSQDIAHEILHGTGVVNLSGEKKKITTFFSDLAGFTTLSEKLSPEELVGFLRSYLGEMSDIIMDQKGFINKYEGDAIMALWGVFGKTSETSNYDACLRALAQQKQIGIINGKRESFGEAKIGVRMGINFGDAIIGNIGREGRKMEFTALGDSVNLASRLEGVNKFYGTSICVSEFVYIEVKEQFEFRYLDKIRVKGKNEPINIYELICVKGKLSDMQKSIILDFEEAIQFYIKRQFKEALEIFNKLNLLGDKPSLTYKNRCELYLENPPNENWDLVWTMNEK
ncbi:MAG: adenylate/guanylate cyclase domain-containing protein [Candidatus Gracilibacteria bacterium]|nr:adenylate/guanylate cyclase domain-containing protein [Candidatus Gracilibacteria bacterium]